VGYRGGYCLTEEPEGIEIDASLCNECGECAALCPSKAFYLEGSTLRRIEEARLPGPESCLELLMSRRSIRHFDGRSVDRELLAKIVSAGRYAPTMNRRISAIVVDDPAIFAEFEGRERRFYSAMYRLFFRPQAARAFIRLFNDDIETIRRKLEHSLASPSFLYGAPALIILTGDTRTILTEESAQYHLFAMSLFAATLGLGSCLMDSARIALLRSRSLRRRLGIPRGRRVLGALVLGHPKERPLNLIEGLGLDLGWNRCPGSALPKDENGRTLP
jgi:nitroreductase